MNGAQILALPLAHYAKLFPDPADIRRVYRGLLLAWHPDRCKEPTAKEVTERIVALHGEACRARDTGTWTKPNVLLAMRSGREVEFSYRAKVAAPAGEMLIGRSHIVTIAGTGMDDLADHAAKIIAEMPPAPAKMREEFSRILPRLDRAVTPKVGRGYTIPLPAGAIRLRDLLAARGPLDPKHVAWIMSGAYNLACYLEFAGITHLGLDADHVFIVPETHEVLLLAGWEFAALRHRKPLAASPLAAAALGSALSSDPTSSRHHLQLIRALGKAALGDPSGAALNGRADLPRPFARWLMFPAGKRSAPEYEAWGRALVDAFGPRRFQPLPLTSSDIYGD